MTSLTRRRRRELWQGGWGTWPLPTLRALPIAARILHTKSQQLFVVRTGGPDHSAAVPRSVLRNVHAPFPQALILCNRLCQTIKELIADPYGKWCRASMQRYSKHTVGHKIWRRENWKIIYSRRNAACRKPRLFSSVEVWTRKQLWQEKSMKKLFLKNSLISICFIESLLRGNISMGKGNSSIIRWRTQGPFSKARSTNALKVVKYKSVIK